MAVPIFEDGSHPSADTVVRAMITMSALSGRHTSASSIAAITYLAWELMNRYSEEARGTILKELRDIAPLGDSIEMFLDGVVRGAPKPKDA